MMNANEIMKIFADNAYERLSGTADELRCAEYIKNYCAGFGKEAYIEDFEVEMTDMHGAELLIDGAAVRCEGYRCCGTGEVEAPFYYMPNKDVYSWEQCRGKIVMLDGNLTHWDYQDLLKYGAVGFITYNGDVLHADDDIIPKELRSFISNGKKMPGVAINAKKAVELIMSEPKMAKISVSQEEYQGNSRNVILDLPGEIEETIVFTAHYDSTPLSQGAYDNLSGAICLLAAAEHFSKNPHRHSLRFIWCGSEERGLLGSKAYVAAHKDELEKIVLDINIDMIGCIMGRFIACCTSEEKLMHYISYMAMEKGFGIAVSQDVYSSDSTPFADQGIPAVSFARRAPSNTATIHNRYDTMAVMKGEHMEKDIAFIISFAERMANAMKCPVAKVMPDNMKEKLDLYLKRKRK